MLARQLPAKCENRFCLWNERILSSASGTCWKLLPFSQFERREMATQTISIISHVVMPTRRSVADQFSVAARRNLQPADIWYFVYNWIEFKCDAPGVRRMPVPSPYATSDH